MDELQLDLALDDATDALDLSARWRNALALENEQREKEGVEKIVTLRDLLCLTESRLLRIENVGSRSISELKRALSHYNLFIGQEAKSS